MKRTFVLILVACGALAVAGCTGSGDNAAGGMQGAMGNGLIGAQPADDAAGTEPSEAGQPSANVGGEDAGANAGDAPPPEALSLSPETDALPPAVTGAPYKALIRVINSQQKSTEGCEWKVDANQLPKGLTISSSSGGECSDQCTGSHIRIAGAPASGATCLLGEGCALTFTVTDPQGGMSVSRTFHLRYASGAIKVQSAEELEAQSNIIGVLGENKGSAKLLLQPDRKEYETSLVNLSADGTMKNKNLLQATFKVSGGKAPYAWEVVRNPQFPWLGEGELAPDPKDPSRVTIRVTRLFPAMGKDPDQDPHASLIVKARDANGLEGGFFLTVTVKYPEWKLTKLNSLEFVGQGVKMTRGEGPVGGMRFEDAEIPVEWTIAYLYSKEKIIANCWESDCHREGTDGVAFNNASVADVSRIELISVKQLAPNVKGGEGANYGYLKLRSAYWEALYDHPHVAEQPVADIIPAMTGYDPKDPGGIWHRRIDILPRPQ